MYCVSCMENYQQTGAYRCGSCCNCRYGRRSTSMLLSAQEPLLMARNKTPLSADDKCFLHYISSTLYQAQRLVLAVRPRLAEVRRVPRLIMRPWSYANNIWCLTVERRWAQQRWCGRTSERPYHAGQLLRYVCQCWRPRPESWLRIGDAARAIDEPALSWGEGCRCPWAWCGNPLKTSDKYRHQQFLRPSRSPLSSIKTPVADVVQNRRPWRGWRLAEQYLRARRRALFLIWECWCRRSESCRLQCHRSGWAGNVVLPAPVAPTKATFWPGWCVQRNIMQHGGQARKYKVNIKEANVSFNRGVINRAVIRMFSSVTKVVLSASWTYRQWFRVD